MNENTILTVKDLSVTLDAIQVLQNVSFSVDKGEALAVIGPNGAGKTALFRALLGLLPHEGSIRWRADTRIDYVPQRFTVERWAPITAMEFCLLKSPSFWRPKAGFIRQVHDEIALMGLGQSILKKNIGELSGGQTQRLLVAWALLQQPDVLQLTSRPRVWTPASKTRSTHSFVVFKPSVVLRFSSSRTISAWSTATQRRCFASTEASFARVLLWKF